MAAKKKIPKVVERRLGRERALGQLHEHKNLVEIDPRQDAKELFDTHIHEGVHAICPYLSEAEVKKVAEFMRRYLWRLKYRRVMF